MLRWFALVQLIVLTGSFMAPLPVLAQLGPQQASEAARICFAKANELRNGGPVSETIVACTAAISERLEDTDVLAELLLARGIAYTWQGALDDALADLDESLRLRPNSIHSANIRAWISREVGDYEAAEKAYSRILENNGTNGGVEDRLIWQAYLSRCVVRQDLERFRLSVSDCETALKGSRTEDTVFFTARAYTELDRCVEAVSLLETAFPHTLISARLYRILGYAHACTGEREKGLAVIEEGIARYPEDQDLRIMRRRLAWF